ncbi:hypothetical protein [Ponticoccus litoralis]|uniref:Uncharacterized protein n=1 Tax=Ponticoccus litoralis TaxID=422297 RepID=A0AAW9SPQ5_9RHOB
MAFIKDNPKFVLLIAVLCCILASIFFVSLYGFGVVVLAGGIIASWVLVGWKDNWIAKWLAGGAFLVGLLGAIVEYPYRRETASVFSLAIEAQTQPGAFGFDFEDNEELFGTVVACGLQGHNDLGSLTHDLAAVIYEPPEASIISWMWKRPVDRKSCLERANALAEKSPAFAVRLKAIMDDFS